MAGKGGISQVCSPRPGDSQAGPLQAVLFVIQPPPGGLEHEGKKKKKLACDKTFRPEFHAELELTNLPPRAGQTAPHTAGTKILIPRPDLAAQNPLATPPSSFQGIPGSLRIPASDTGHIPGWRAPIPLLPVPQLLTSADVGRNRLRRRHERLREQSRKLN